MVMGLLVGTCATYYHNFVWKLPAPYGICRFIASVITMVAVSIAVALLLIFLSGTEVFSIRAEVLILVSRKEL
jgi:hypothetical protein